MSSVVHSVLTFDIWSILRGESKPEAILSATESQIRRALFSFIASSIPKYEESSALDQ
ncbi:hypothetical protein SDC9_131415 [bioreactor metagenome]|uniref:Uncharacterized protein n=1 Tax=bioreactor metagenome TaxID=1076179 RepID=A0A645D4U4_9ZZZZ